MTEALEDYLEAIGVLIEANTEARVKDIADRLQVSKPTVHAALHDLEDRGYVMHEPYGAVHLTKSGKALAEVIREKHRVIKSFLQGLLGVDRETAEREACSLEHDLSDGTIARIARLLRWCRSDGTPVCEEVNEKSNAG